jgi:hypothetical protein
MPERLHRRLGGHVRRHSLAYAVLALAVSISPAPSMAAELINSEDIANGAVTQPKLAADSVVSGGDTTPRPAADPGPSVNLGLREHHPR